MAKPWLTGEIGIAPAPSQWHEIKAVLGSLEYAKEQISYSNFDCGNLDKAIKLVKSHLPKRPPTRPPV